MATKLSDPLAISLVAQRMFHQRILLALISAGVMTKDRAAEISTDVAGSIRGLNTADTANVFVEQLARSYEQIALAVTQVPNRSA